MEKETSKTSTKIRGSHVCKSCESIMVPKRLYKGTLAVEIIMWLLSLALVPVTAGISLAIGLSYSVWRIVNKPRVCSVCGSADIVPVDTPAGRKIIKSLGLVES